MRSAVYCRPRDVRVKEVAEPRVEAGQVKVRVAPQRCLRMGPARIFLRVKKVIGKMARSEITTEGSVEHAPLEKLLSVYDDLREGKRMKVLLDL